MDSTNFFEKMPEQSREKLLNEINITSNEEFISWMTVVPRKILTDHFDIPEELIDEIMESELYLRFTSNVQNYRFGYIPESDNNGGQNHTSE